MGTRRRPTCLSVLIPDRSGPLAAPAAAAARTGSKSFFTTSKPRLHAIRKEFLIKWITPSRSSSVTPIGRRTRDSSADHRAFTTTASMNTVARHSSSGHDRHSAIPATIVPVIRDAVSLLTETPCKVPRARHPVDRRQARRGPSPARRYWPKPGTAERMRRRSAAHRYRGHAAGGRAHRRRPSPSRTIRPRGRCWRRDDGRSREQPLKWRGPRWWDSPPRRSPPQVVWQQGVVRRGSVAPDSR